MGQIEAALVARGFSKRRAEAAAGLLHYHARDLRDIAAIAIALKIRSVVNPEEANQ